MDSKAKSDDREYWWRDMKGEDEEAQLVCWGKKTTGGMVADHAIGLVVDESQIMRYDNE